MKYNVPLLLRDVDLPADARLLVFMENMKTGHRRELLNGEDTAAEKAKVLKEFANAVVSSVVRAGKALRIIYLDENRTDALSVRLAEQPDGQQMSLF